MVWLTMYRYARRTGHGIIDSLLIAEWFSDRVKA